MLNSLFTHSFLSSLFPLDNVSKSGVAQNLRNDNDKLATSYKNNGSKVKRKSRKSKNMKEIVVERCAYEERPERIPFSNNAHYAVKDGSVSVVTQVLFASFKPSQSKSSCYRNERVSPPSSPSSLSSSSKPFPFCFHFKEEAALEEESNELSGYVNSYIIDSATPSEYSDSEVEDDQQRENVETNNVPKALPRLILSSSILHNNMERQPNSIDVWKRTPCSILTSCHLVDSNTLGEVVSSDKSSKGCNDSELDDGCAPVLANSIPKKHQKPLTIKEKREQERRLAEKELQWLEAQRLKKATSARRKTEKQIRKEKQKALEGKFERVDEKSSTVSRKEDYQDLFLSIVPPSFDKQSRAETRANDKAHGREKRERAKARDS